MASYRDDELQTLGDILARMKPLPDPPPGATDDEQVRTQQHNDALAQLQSNARVARALAENTINRGGAFPDSLLHFVPGRLVGSLGAIRAGGSDPWADQPSTDSLGAKADPWESYGKSAFAAGGPNSSAAAPATAVGNGSINGISPLIPVPPGASIADNMNVAKAHRIYGALKYPWFYFQVHNGGPWDYKQTDKPKYAPFGNFNYGATGAKLGVPLEVLLRMAGVAQKRAGTSSPAFGSNPGLVPSFRGTGGLAPYGDDPIDQMFIKQGFQYAQPVFPKPDTTVTTDKNGATGYWQGHGASGQW